MSHLFLLFVTTVKRRAISLLVILACCLLSGLLFAGNAMRSDSTAAPQPSGEAMPALRGEEAVAHLKEQGTYDSLRQAMANVYYEANWQRTPLMQGVGEGYELKNPRHGLLAYVTGNDLQMGNLTQGKTSWRLGLRLKEYGYGKAVAAAARGAVNAKGNRVEIAYRGASGSETAMTEWFVNSIAGLEHGFTLAKAPGDRKAGEPLQVRLAVDGDLQMQVNASQREAYFYRESDNVLIRYHKLFVSDAKGRAINSRMRQEGRELVIEADDAEAEYPLTIDPLFTEQPKLTAADGAANDNFGSAVAVSGDTAVVGAPNDDVGANSNQGSAYIFVRVGMAWSQQQKLTAADGGAGDQFGIAVGIVGNIVIVGAPHADVAGNSDQGAAYVFVRSTVTWAEKQKLTAADGTTDDLFGGAVSFSDNSAVIGASSDDVSGHSNQGSAYVFVRNGSIWTQQQKLTASDGAADDLFGQAVSISNDTVIVGAPTANVAGEEEQGAAYIFVRNGTMWTQQQKLTALDGSHLDQFGNAVSIDGDTVVVGAWQEDSTSVIADDGAAYVFVRSGATWTQQQKLTPASRIAHQGFGYAVAINGETLVVGAPGDEVTGGSFPRAAYIFVRSGTTWAEQQILENANVVANDQFGNAVGVNGDTVIVGAPIEDIGGNLDQGSAFLAICDWQEVTELLTEGAAGDHFGDAVAISGDTAIVGSGEDDAGIHPEQFSDYVFVRSGSTLTEQQKLTASDGAGGDQFGIAVGISGDTVIVGAFRDDVGSSLQQGSAYIFVRSGTTWSQQQKLTASDGAADDQFGIAVSISGDTVIVGASGDDVAANPNQGSAYVFIRSGTLWSQQQKLTAADGAADDQFGTAVGINDDTAIVGASRANVAGNTDQGAAYVFVRSGITWTEQQKLIASDGANFDTFGNAVSISGETVVVAARADDLVSKIDAGSVYVFVRSGTTWALQQKLMASDGSSSDVFGHSVAIHSDTVIVGALLEDGSPNADEGAAYVYVRSGTTWAEQQKLTAADRASKDEFGHSVAVSNDTVMIGARLADVETHTDRGAAYAFIRSGVVWTQQQKLIALVSMAVDQFGNAVAVQGDTVVVGAGFDEVGANADQGSVSVFVRNENIWVLQQRLTAADGAANDQFGYSVAIDGNHLVVGALRGDIGTNTNEGAAYVYARSGTMWSPQQKLTAADGSTFDSFGVAVSISGDTIIVGASGDDVGANANQGSAYVFIRSGTLWSQQQKLTAADGAALDQLGGSVAISGQTAVVGASFDDEVGGVNQGSAYVFVRSGTLWSQQQKLTASDGAANDLFGHSVAINAERVAIGAVLDDVSAQVDQGSAYVFVRNGTTWSQQQKLTASDGATNDQFGHAVSLNSDSVIVGALVDDVNAQTDQGSVYMFIQLGANWAEKQQIIASNGAANDQFGVSAAIDGNTMVVGAWRHDAGPISDRGGAYIYSLGCNTAPQIIGGNIISAQRGSLPTSTTIAYVRDSEDPDGALIVTVVSAPAGIQINGITNINGTITASVSAACTATLGNNLVTLQVTDSDGAISQAQLTVVVAANSPPTLGLYPTTNVQAGSTITITPSAPPSDNGTITSLIASPIGFTGSLSTDALTGEIFISDTGESGSFIVNVIAVDNCGASSLRTCRLNVNCPTITVSPATIPNAIAGAPYSQTFTESGGQGAITFSLTGALPAGLMFAGDTLSGTPAEVGAFPITVTATDQYNCAGSRNYTLMVNAPMAVWNGSMSSDWHTAANWTPNVVPTTYHDVLIPMAGVINQPTIGAASSEINAMTVQAGRVLTINSSRELETASDVTSTGAIAGAGKLSLEGETFTQDGSVSVAAVEFAAGNHRLAGGGSFASNIITVLNGASVKLMSDHSVSVVVINSGGTFDAANQTLTLTGAGTPIFNSGTFDATGSTIIYQGAVAQVVTDNIAYHNLTVNNAAGVSLAGETTANGVLNLMTDLMTGSFTLMMPASGSSTGAGDVIGTVRRTGFIVGSPLSFGNPHNTVRFDSGTVPTAINVNLLKGTPANFPSNAVTRIYTITPEGGSGYSATLRLRYKDAELNGVSETMLELWRYNGSAWVSPSGEATRDTAQNFVEETGITEFSPWAIAGPTGPTSIDLVSFAATQYETGTLLEWQTGWEADNLGFNLYCEAEGRRALVNPQIIAGSALRVGAGVRLEAGESYVWWDAQDRGHHDFAYWLEDLDLNGKSTWHGPFYPRPAVGKSTFETRSHTLAEINTRQREGAASRVVEPRASHLRMSSLAVQSSLATAATATIKIGVRRAGWYRITGSELLAAGLPANVNPRNLQLFVEGNALACRVNGEEDGRLDESDTVEFYGTGLDTPTSDKRIYWLVAGAQAGLRLPTVEREKSIPAPQSFASTVERRDRTVYFAALKNGDAENFFGAVVSTAPVEQALTLKDLASDEKISARLELALQGVTEQTHQVSIALNGQLIGNLNSAGQVRPVATFEIPLAQLAEGVNLVTLQSQNGASDLSLVDFIRLTYPRRYRAEADTLLFTAPSGHEVRISGFDNKDLVIFDVTDEMAVRALAFDVEEDGDGYTAIVTMSGAGERRVIALSRAQILSAASLEFDHPSNWRTPNHSADFLIIAHGSLIQSMTLLAEWRKKQGLTVETVAIEDIYDEFSFSHPTPQAIRDLLGYAAKNWRRAPKYVLFAGDASFDPRDYLGLGLADLVPTKLIDTELLETASDDWFADFNDDGIPEIAVGRLPVRSSEEVKLLVGKLITYETAKPAKTIVLVADRNDGYNFEEASENLRSRIPNGYQVTEVFRSRSDDQTARAQLLGAINRGAAIVNYTGHGSQTLWRGNLLTTSDAASLTNQERLSLFITMTCLNGFFHTTSDSLAEMLLKAPQGGAVGVWASSALTAPDGQAAMNRAFYEQVFRSGLVNLRLGEAMRRAKASIADGQVRRTWILFGDPAMQMK